ncbi:MAG: hypothetical protein J0L92_07500 [Deltaproteobacteria bacterium]|nr:hypothetical protein [Deltaproteobacteria bacterium]
MPSSSPLVALLVAVVFSSGCYVRASGPVVRTPASHRGTVVVRQPARPRTVVVQPARPATVVVRPPRATTVIVSPR